MGWKEALGFENPRWIKIGEHIARITQEKLKQQGKGVCDLTNHLREVGNQQIEPAYVEEYLSGKTSFGCFFPQFRGLLGIVAGDVFKNSSEEQAQQYLKSLDRYLTTTLNPEAAEIFLKFKPGEELRRHVRDFLTRKREEKLAEPYQSFTVGVGVEPKEFDDMLRGVILEELTIRQIADRLNETGLVLAKVPEMAVTIYPGESNLKNLHSSLINRINEKVNDGWHRYSLVEKDSVIKIQPALIRGKLGVTVDFYRNPDGFDRAISGEDEEGIGREMLVGLEAWREAYAHGTFSKLESEQALSNLGFALGFGIDEIVPLREPTPAERYEIHQRWVWAGGRYMPGENIKGPREVERQMKNRPDPVGRSEFEETAYKINSTLTMTFGLYSHISELVKGPVDYKESDDK